MKNVYGAISSCAINKSLTVFIINLLSHGNSSLIEPLMLCARCAPQEGARSPDPSSGHSPLWGMQGHPSRRAPRPGGKRPPRPCLPALAAPWPRTLPGLQLLPPQNCLERPSPPSAQRPRPPGVNALRDVFSSPLPLCFGGKKMSKHKDNEKHSGVTTPPGAAPGVQVAGRLCHRVTPTHIQAPRTAVSGSH